MGLIDWTIVVVYLGWVVTDGIRRARGTDKLEGYFLADRSLPWWAVGLSVMATQLSAVTLIGTPAQRPRPVPPTVSSATPASRGGSSGASTASASRRCSARSPKPPT